MTTINFNYQPKSTSFKKENASSSWKLHTYTLYLRGQSWKCKNNTGTKKKTTTPKRHLCTLFVQGNTNCPCDTRLWSQKTLFRAFHHFSIVCRKQSFGKCRKRGVGRRTLDHVAASLTFCDLFWSRKRIGPAWIAISRVDHKNILNVKHNFLAD